MNLTKKITQVFALIFLVFFAASCQEGCVEADEFNVESVVIESNPVNDGVYGTYDPITGGQRADWHVTGLKANGDRFLIQIGGEWTSWDGQYTNSTSLRALPRCNFCAKKNNSTPNCICYNGQNPAPEKGPDGNPRTDVNCNVYADQNDPDKCTCTRDPQYGTVMDYGTYHFPLNILNKDETYKIADRQSACKYDRGMGAYIALFGPRGITTPIRSYHLFSQDEVCNVVRNSNGQCLDVNGNDVTRYVFKSANNRIFMKDDGNGNTGSDNNTANDVYHTPNEDVKVIMYDSYYNDNYGRYNIKILRGVGNKNDTGLLEYLVRMVEDVVLGKIGDDGDRHGGIIEFMYKAIVQDSGFILVVQLSLSLYITVYGAATLFGVAEINKKELMTRTLKIGLIIFFTSKESWYFYNKIIIGLFKDSMDSVVAMLMDLSDSNLDQSSMTVAAQMDRENSVSNATRFSYVDLIIKKLFSDGVAKKVFGLFFTNIFGWLYILAIYALIGFFIYVMLYVASIYLVNVLKIIFVLCLGPIFMCFTLFSKTEAMFKNWLAFLAARSLEIVMLFAILYSFLMIIDKNFTDLLSYRVCAENKGIGPIKLIVLISYIDRTFVNWMLGLISIGGLIFMMKLVVDKVPDVAGYLISIGGVANKDATTHAAYGASAMTGAMVSTAFGLAKDAAGVLASGVGTVASLGARGATAIARKTGIADKFNSLTEKIPFRGPRTRYRDSIIDGAIKRAQAQAGGKSGKDRDAFIRNSALKDLQYQMYSDPKKMALAGVDMHNIAKRMDQKLIDEPLRKFIAEESKKQRNAKGAPLFGKAAREAVKKAAEEFATKNFYEGSESRVKALLDSSATKELLKEHSDMTSSEAAKRFAGNKEAQNQYLQHLKKREAKRELAKQDESGISKAGGALSRFAGNLRRDARSNPKMMQRNFVRKVGLEENGRKWWNPAQNINVLGQLTDKRNLDARNEELQKKTLRDQLAKGFRDDAKKRAQDERRARYYADQLREMAVAPLRDAVGNIRDLESKGKLSAAEAREGFKESGGTMMEKLARLGFRHDQLGLQGENPQAFMSHLMREQMQKLYDNRDKMSFADVLAARNGIMNGFVNGSELPQQFQNYLLDGAALPKASSTTNLNDNMIAVREMTEKMQEEYNKNLKAIEEVAARDSAAVAAKLAEAQQMLDAGNKDGAIAASKEASGLVAHNLQVEFGSSITKVLLEAPNVGLQASNVMLGVAEKKEGEVDPVVEARRRMVKNQADSRKKMADMDKKIAEFEKEKLDKNDPQYQQKLADLDEKIAQCEKEIKKLDNEIADADKN